MGTLVVRQWVMEVRWSLLLVFGYTSHINILTCIMLTRCNGSFMVVF